MIDTQGKFYLGRIVDPKTGKATEQPLLYDAEDLTTHAFVVGMTGSGKTGLCIGLLEEAALNGVPALMIDPKGDITNTLLHFPNLLPQDFQPWIDPDQARRAGQSLEQAAQDAAASWKKGLADWDIGSERIQKLKDSAQFAIFTPGSDAGLPVSILASFECPPLPWEANREVLREKISSTVTALLGLIGFTNVDPVRSREHILLSNILENAWSQGADLNLSELILQTQNPPFDKLGVFEVNTFFPQKDRFELAKLLNNIMAAPSFQAWIEGQPLDAGALLYTPEGKPRQSVFYIAHLSEPERMFFVTLLFSAIESWMRTQSGSTSLRALVYFDEIFGYVPPIGNPAPKQPILRMLKQARAFGIGLVLVTQNPVDVDYKGISNTGTWFIGKLQTDQDKQRLLDGLQGAVAGVDRSTYDKMISGLGKRVFLMHNVHNKEPLQEQTRWVMNYLAGPLTRAQIPALNALAGASTQATAPVPAVPSATPGISTSAPQKATVAERQTIPQASSTRPPVPVGVSEFFLPNNQTLSQALKSVGNQTQHPEGTANLVYRPVLIGQSKTLFLDRRYNLDYELTQSVLVANPDRRGVVRWEDYVSAAFDDRQMDDKPLPQARFASLDAPLSDGKIISALSKDFVDWVYRSTKVTVRSNDTLKIYGGPEVTEADFQKMCDDAAQKGRADEIKKVGDGFDKKIDALQVKINREQRELKQDETRLSQRKLEEAGNIGEGLFGLFTGKKVSRKVSSALTKRRMSAQAKAEVDESKEAIADFEKQIAELKKAKEAAVNDVEQRWDDIASKASEISVAAMKKDIRVDLFGVAWFPYYSIQSGDQTLEFPAFTAS